MKHKTEYWLHVDSFDGKEYRYNRDTCETLHVFVDGDIETTYTYNIMSDDKTRFIRSVPAHGKGWTKVEVIGCSTMWRRKVNDVR